MLRDLLKILSQYCIPQHTLSRLAGWLARLEKPTALKNGLINQFIQHYQVDMSEALLSSPAQYPTFNAFFTRNLNPQARPVDPHPNTIVSPADGTVSACGSINDETLLQAKGHTYTLTALLGGETNAINCFKNGHFATIYLSPRDYHRVHIPFTGKITQMTYIPGKLFSVNNHTAEHVPGLFARNERIICYFDTAIGPMAIIMVGAMIVASMATRWTGVVPAQSRITHSSYPSTLPLVKGEEMGYFQLGSTVIILFSPNTVDWLPYFQSQTTVKVGQAIAHLRSK